MICWFPKIPYWPQWLAGFIVSFAVTITGLSNGWTSPILAQLTAPNNTHLVQLTEAEASWFASLQNIGRFVGAIFGAFVQEYIGRKKTLLMGSVPLTAGWVCILVANSVPWLYAGRLFCGFACGTIWSGLSLFVGEIGDPKIRGALILLNLNMTSIGMFLGIVMGPYMSKETFSCVSLTGTGIFIALFWFVPDSPYHHIANGDMSKAEKSLKWYKRETDVKRELQELQDFVGSTNIGFWKRFQEFKKNPTHFKHLMIPICLNVFLFCSGHNTMNYYAEIIVTKTGVQITPSIVVIALGFSAVIAGATATIVVDKFGRRSLLMVSASVAGISLALLGAHFHMLSMGFDPSSITWVPIFALFLFNFSTYYGFVPIPSALVSELFPPIIKTLASMIYSSSSSLMAFSVSKAFQPYIDLVGEKYVFWSFALSAFSSVAFTYFIVPETKGKSLVEIQQSFKKDHHKSADLDKETNPKLQNAVTLPTV